MRDKEEYNQRRRTKRASDPEKRALDNARRRAHYQANRETARQKARENYTKNAERYREASRKWKQNNPELRKSTAIKSTYGLTPEQHQAMFYAQQGLCALCGLTGKLVIDHDHVTGKVRGLIHGSCNSGLGYFKDSPELCQLAKIYLEKHKCSM